MASATFDLRYQIQIAPIVQWASSRPYTPITGIDTNGDGLVSILDRLCDGVDPPAVFDVRANLPAIQALNPNGCQPRRRNNLRSGLVVNPDGSIEERNGRFFNIDLRVSKAFALGTEGQRPGLRGLLQPVQHGEPVVHAAARAELRRGCDLHAAGISGGSGIRTSRGTAVHDEPGRESDVLAPYVARIGL